MSGAAKPWMMFYPQDWRADESLRLCSLAARGLWVELLALMHRSERYGYLLVKGKPPTDRQLAALVGGAIDEVAAGVAELEEFEVFSRDRNGTIYSRRMIRDEKRVKTNRKNGSKGGNPNLSKQTGIPASDNQEDIRGVKAEVKPQSPEFIYSVSDDTGANGAFSDDPDKVFWANAKAMLQPHCRGDAGKVVGQWLRDNGKELTIAALTAAQLEKAVNPIEYCQGYFRRNRIRPVSSSGGGSDDGLAARILEEKRDREAFEARQAAVAGGGR